MVISIRLRLRLAVVASLLAGLLVGHVSLRYLFGTLFGFVKYRGLAPVAPFVVLIGYMLLLVGAAVLAVVRWGSGGIVPGTGLALLAVEPIASSYVWGDGCEVSSTTRGTLVPEITVSTARITLHPWNGACSVSLTPAIIGIGIVLVAGGLWVGGVPEMALRRWMAWLDRYLPSRTSE